VLVVAAVQDLRNGQSYPFANSLLDPALRCGLSRRTRSTGLGEGARDCVAHFDRVAYSKPGLGYVMLDGQRELVDVRAATSPDEAIAGSRPLTRRLAALSNPERLDPTLPARGRLAE
jgi:hypothetical protein